MTFTCRLCGFVGEKESFAVDKNRKHGIQYKCRECHKQKCKEWRLNNLEKSRRTARERKAKHRAVRDKEYDKLQAQHAKDLILMDEAETLTQTLHTIIHATAYARLARMKHGIKKRRKIERQAYREAQHRRKIDKYSHTTSTKYGRALLPLYVMKCAWDRKLEKRTLNQPSPRAERAKEMPWLNT